MKTLPKHVYKQVTKGRVYYRHRPSGARLPDPKSPAFAQAYAAALRQTSEPGPMDEAALRYALSDSLPRARSRAAQCQLAFDLTPEFVADLMRAQNFTCAVSGLRFDLFRTGAREKRVRLPFRPSLDKIIPELGYVQGNVRIVCFAVNMALSDYGDDVFHEIVTATAKKLRQKQAS